MTTSLVIFTKAAEMLAEANTIQLAKELKDLSITAMEWAKRKDMGEEAIQHCRKYGLLAERRMGEMLAATERDVGGRPSKDKPLDTNEGLSMPTLAEIGITYDESAKAQALAKLPEALFEEVSEGEKTRTQAAREQKRAAVTERLVEMPSGKFRVIYADPPWKYGDQLTEDYGPTRFHYPSMSIAELSALPIRELCDDDAVLFLWVTSPLLFECAPMIHAWDFKYKTSFVWDKIKHNMGHYNSVRHEFLLVCTRGSCTPDVTTLFDSVQSIERTTHSTKPQEFRQIIETLYPHGKRLEMFARQESPGWQAYGNQVAV